MPTYEYKCLVCDKSFDAFQKMSDAPLTECKYCQGKVRRVISGGTGVIFKGSGFYCTDYKSKSSASGSTKKSAKKETSCDPSTCKECPAAESSSSE